jgi:two-component system response regulator PilR (NtrC family)
LRERREDIPALTRYFVKKVAGQEGQAEPIVLTEAFEAFSSYDFPGNVRELQNMVERAVALCGGRPIGPEVFEQHLRQTGSSRMAATDLPAEGVDLEDVLVSVERRLLEQALRRSNGIKKEAARLLGISFRSIRYRLLKHGLE